MTLSLLEIEGEIDRAFESNPLITLPLDQAVWTVLSVAEDLHYFRLLNSGSDDQAQAVFADNLMNALTYPVRTCQVKCEVPQRPSIERRLIDDHYQWAVDWLRAAEDYSQFCTVFPLHHAGELSLKVEAQALVPHGWNTTDLAYESYDRLVSKREERLLGDFKDGAPLLAELRRHMKIRGGLFSVEFTRSVIASLRDSLGPTYERRHDLPPHWKFTQFYLSDYRKVIVSLQLLAHGWFYARQIAANSRAAASAFASAVWMPRKGELVALLAKASEVSKSSVATVLGYLTFGGMGIRSPDIAIQPLVDLGHEHWAVSPFVLMHLNAERNLCVLLNQVPADRRVYSHLVNEKEQQARENLIAETDSRGLRFAFGRVKGTDVDLAIIDDVHQFCLCVEIKWFIEPAEVREILDRTKELSKGVKQCSKLAQMFQAEDAQLMSLLGVTRDYSFLSVVGSSSFIGPERVQCESVPIVKLWHLGARIRDHGLPSTVNWLRERKYLPVKGLHYLIHDREIECGGWKANWYGIEPKLEFPDNSPEADPATSPEKSI